MLILEIIFTLIILAITYIYVEWVYKTKKQMNRYKTQFQAKGFKVKMLSYKFFGIPFYEKIEEGYKRNGQPTEFMKHGMDADVMISSLILKPQIHIINPVLTQEFYTKTQHHYQKPRRIIQNFVRAIGEGLILSQGNTWKRKRKILSNIFHFNFVRSLAKNMAMISDKVFDEFDSHKKDNKMWILEEFKKITSKLLLKSFFGFKIDDIKLEGIPIGLYFVDLLDKLSMQSLHPISAIFGDNFFKLGLRQIDRDVNKMIKVYKEFILEYIKTSYQEFKQRQKNGKINQSNGDNNILEELFRAGTIKHTSNSIVDSSSDNLDYSQLMAEFGNFMTGGIDTTSILCTNVIAQLNNNPEILEKLQKQIDQYIKNEQDYNADNLKNMKYLLAIINEALRCDPPLSSVVGRHSIIDTEFGGVRIQKGTILYVQILPNQYNPKYFEKPDEFLPQRWLNQKQEPFSFTPFSAGPRNCIGQQLALLQAKVIISKFVKRYKFTIKQPIRRYHSMAETPEKFDTFVERKS